MTKIRCVVIEIFFGKKLLIYKEVFLEFKKEFFFSKFEGFESNAYADAMETIKLNNFFTSINTKISIVTRKIEAENKQKLKKRKL